MSNAPQNAEANNAEPTEHEINSYIKIETQGLQDKTKSLIKNQLDSIRTNLETVTDETKTINYLERKNEQDKLNRREPSQCAAIQTILKTYSDYEGAIDTRLGPQTITATKHLQKLLVQLYNKDDKTDKPTMNMQGFADGAFGPNTLKLFLRYKGDIKNMKTTEALKIKTQKDERKQKIENFDTYEINFKNKGEVAKATEFIKKLDTSTLINKIKDEIFGTFFDNEEYMRCFLEDIITQTSHTEAGKLIVTRLLEEHPKDKIYNKQTIKDRIQSKPKIYTQYLTKQQQESLNEKAA